MAGSIVSLQRKPCAGFLIRTESTSQREKLSAESRGRSEDHCEIMASWPQRKQASGVECYRCGCIFCEARQQTQNTRHESIFMQTNKLFPTAHGVFGLVTLPVPATCEPLLKECSEQCLPHREAPVLSRNGAISKHIDVPSWVRRCTGPCVPLERSHSFLASLMGEKPDRATA